MKDFYNGKKIFITGNTGFKGTWISNMLLLLGADIFGYSQKAEPLFNLCQMSQNYPTIYGDVRDYDKLIAAMKNYNPDLVFHLAAQPLVIEGYNSPRATFDVNVMGTVNLLSAVSQCENVGSVVNVTTDKVYKNLEIDRAYIEEDVLGGKDPYSASKSCSEIVTTSFAESFKHSYGIATARAGNVIGGGDFAANRILPDCIRAAEAGRSIDIRNPQSVRPWQHVLEPLTGYLMLGKYLYKENNQENIAFNFGPELKDCITVGELVSLFCDEWGCDGDAFVNNLDERKTEEKQKEAGLLLLDSSKSKESLNWGNIWSVKEAVEKTVAWYKIVNAGEDAREMSLKQIDEYMKVCDKKKERLNR